MAINKRRLRALVRMIDELPEDTPWDMHSGRNCALGHAAHDPWFTSKGFGWDDEDGNVRFGEARGDSAVMTFFGLGRPVYRSLFLDWTARSMPTQPGDTREAVAARILNYVDGLVDHRRAKT